MTLAEERKEGNKTIHVWKLTEEEIAKAKKAKEEAKKKKAERK